MTINCGECGAIMILRSSKHGQFYGCSRFPHCQGTHGAHADGKPFGTPATKETKRARVRAHNVFEQWWYDKNIQRRHAYARLKEHFGFEVHIGESDIAMCESIIKFCEEN